MRFPYRCAGYGHPFAGRRGNLFASAEGIFGGRERLRPWELPGVLEYWDTRYGITSTDERVSAWLGRKGLYTLEAAGAARPILLPHSGTNYLLLPGVNSNDASAPDSVALSVSGDIDLRVWLAADDWTPSAIQQIFTKSNTTGTREWEFTLLTDGKLRFVQSGVANLDSSVATGFTDFAFNWIRVTRSATTGDTKFYTSSDGTTWTQLGTTVSGATGAITDGNNPVIVGNQGANSQALAGKVRRAQIYAGIDGTLVFDANFALVSEGATSFTESSSNGATVTINSTGSKPAQIVGSQQILFDGAAHYMDATFTKNQPYSEVLVFKAPTWASGDTFLDGVGTANRGRFLQDNQAGSASPDLNMYSGSYLLADGAQLDTLALNTYGIVAMVWNGASSSIRVNLGAVLTGDPGSGNPDGTRLGAIGGVVGSYGNEQLKAYAVCNSALISSLLTQHITANAREHRVSL